MCSTRRPDCGSRTPGCSRKTNCQAARSADIVGHSSLETAVDDLHDELMLLDQLNPLTTEVVRLRAASYHDCHT